MNVTCPECGAEWELSGVEQGEIVTCPDCGVDLEVLTTNPITVGLAKEGGPFEPHLASPEQAALSTPASDEDLWPSEVLTIGTTVPTFTVRVP